MNTGGDTRVETDITTPHKYNDTKYPEKTTPDPRVDPTTSSIPKTPKKRTMLQIVRPEPVYPQQSMYITLTYKERALATPLAIYSETKDHVLYMAEKCA